MINHQSTGYRYSLRRRVFAWFAAALISIMAFSLVQPVGAFNAVQDGSTPPGVIGFHGIYKKASKFLLAAGDGMTYTIHLETDATTAQLADVSDPLPTGLDYVAGSASAAGTYDASTRTVSWSQVPVAAGSPVDLTFNVTDTATVTFPTPTVNTASITLNGRVLLRQAWVTLMPSHILAPGLMASFKSAAPFKLGPGDVVTYTIHLINSSDATVTAQVSDPLPAPLTFVADSASTGGVYDATTHTVAWSDVSVPPATPVLLTFQAAAPAVFPTALRPVVVSNKVTIASGAYSFKREAAVLLVPPPAPPLAGSFKMASQRKVTPGETFNYTITLNNSSDAPVPATVTDPLPAEVTYVAGSANAGGVYDDTTRTLTWNDLSVLDGTPLVLTFDVTAETTLTAPDHAGWPDGFPIKNTAAIVSGDVTLMRSAQVWLVPAATGDITPPVVNSFTIGDTDVFTGPDVTLNIAAHDDVAVTSMYLVEWVLTGKPFPHWQSVKSSGWIPYQATFAWTLSDTSGTHYVGVWVADAALNRSKLTRLAIDSASLVQPASQIKQGEMIPYLVYYPAGVDVTVTLTSTNGEAHLHLWKPGNMFAPDQSSAAAGTAPQTLTFTTEKAGMYLFLVFGKTDAVYDLSITPGGGPRPAPSATAAFAPSLSNGASPASLAADDGLTFDPILPQSGLDPLNVAPDPSFNWVYLPVLVR